MGDGAISNAATINGKSIALEVVIYIFSAMLLNGGA